MESTVLALYDHKDHTLATNYDENEQALDVSRLEAIKQSHASMASAWTSLPFLTSVYGNEHLKHTTMAGKNGCVDVYRKNQTLFP